MLYVNSKSALRSGSFLMQPLLLTCLLQGTYSGFVTVTGHFWEKWHLGGGQNGALPVDTLKITINFVESEVRTIPVKSDKATITCTVSVVITVLKH